MTIYLKNRDTDVAQISQQFNIIENELNYCEILVWSVYPFLIYLWCQICWIHTILGQNLVMSVGTPSCIQQLNKYNMHVYGKDHKPEVKIPIFLFPFSYVFCLLCSFLDIRQTQDTEFLLRKLIQTLYKCEDFSHWHKLHL